MGNFKRKTSRKNIKQVKHNMRCKNSLENKTKKQVAAEFFKQAISDRAIEEQTIADTLIIFIYSLNKVYGFGRKRIVRFFQKATLTASCIRGGYVTFDDLQTMLKQEAKYKYYRMNVNDLKTREQKVKMRVIEEMTLIYIFSVMDVFEFKEKRICRLVKAMGEIGQEPTAKKYTIDDIEKYLWEKVHVNFDHDFSHVNDEGAA